MGELPLRIAAPMSHRALASEPVQRVLDRLEALGKIVRWATDQHMAQCPAHDDRNPSLAIREGDEGAILTCHAGCSTDDVCEALGLELRDLFPKKDPWENGRAGKFTYPRGPSSAEQSSPSSPRQQHVAERNRADILTTPSTQASSLTWVADYIYRDADGVAQFKVSRFAQLDERGDPIGKSFRQYRRDRSGAGWTAGLNGASPPLYRLPEVLAAVAAGEPILVVEGEKDADAAVAAGWCATTAPMGAGKWRDTHTESLRDGRVVILADDDPPGHAHALAVHEALRPVATSVVIALPARGCKDLSDHLSAGHGIDQIRPCAPEALAVPPGDQDVSDSQSANPEAEAPSRLSLTPASAIVIERVRWGWKDRMPVGELTLIPGREGVGKSLLLAHLAAELTKGTLDGEFRGTPRAVLYVASEDSWNYTVAPRMKVAGADLGMVYRVNVIDDGRISLPADCEEVAQLARLVDAAAVMLDPVISLIHHSLSVNQAAELRRALEPLRRTAERAGLILPALAHFNKTTDTDVLSKIPGSRAWAEVARAAFGVAEDRDAGGYVGSQIKNNLGRLDLPHLTYRIESVLIDAADGKADVGRLVWTGQGDTGVEEVLSRKPEKRARDTSDITKTIVGYIEECGYPMVIGDIYAQFPQIKRETVRQTLRRAADRGTLSKPADGIYGPGDGP